MREKKKIKINEENSRSNSKFVTDSKCKKNGVIKDILLEHIKLNKKEYLEALILFFAGVMIGVMFINNTSEIQGEEISGYLTEFVNTFKENSSIDKFGLLQQSILENLGLTLLLWFVGGAVIGVPIVCGIVIFRGFSLGYTIASVIATLGIGKGLLFGIITIGIKNIIFIPCILALSVSGFKLSKSIFKDKRKENIKFEIYRHSFFSLLIGIFLVISSLMESYVATALLKMTIKII